MTGDPTARGAPRPNLTASRVRLLVGPGSTVEARSAALAAVKDLEVLGKWMDPGSANSPGWAGGASGASLSFPAPHRAGGLAALHARADEQVALAGRRGRGSCGRAPAVPAGYRLVAWASMAWAPE